MKFKCPICGRTVEGYPALSRKDNKTEICSDCGVKEALIAAGMMKSVNNEFPEGFPR